MIYEKGNETRGFKPGLFMNERSEVYEWAAGFREDPGSPAFKLPYTQKS